MFEKALRILGVRSQAEKKKQDAHSDALADALSENTGLFETITFAVLSRRTDDYNYQCFLQQFSV